MFVTIKACPLCKCKKYKKKVIYNKKNVYSFLIAKYLKLKEQIVIENMKNVICSNCSLIYKKKWIDNKVTKYIYDKTIPVHNACLNIHYDNFSKKNFINILSNYKKSLENEDNENKDKSVRELIKIINSIDSKDKNFKKLKKNVIYNLNKKNLKKILFYSNKIKKFILKPLPFSQFVGFGNNNLWNFLMKKIFLKKNSNYAEIGCPSWGMMKIALNKGLKVSFLNHKNKNFFNCIYNLDKSILVENLNKKKIYDYIGIYNYIDHVINISNFLKKTQKISKNIGIITCPYNPKDKLDCQHFLAFQKKTFNYLNTHFNLKLLQKPYKLGRTNYKFYILKNEISRT